MTEDRISSEFLLNSFLICVYLRSSLLILPLLSYPLYPLYLPKGSCGPASSSFSSSCCFFLPMMNSRPVASERFDAHPAVLAGEA
jgi:hypothetical protein